MASLQRSASETYSATRRGPKNDHPPRYSAFKIMKNEKENVKRLVPFFMEKGKPEANYVPFRGRKLSAGRMDSTKRRSDGCDVIMYRGSSLQPAQTSTKSVDGMGSNTSIRLCGTALGNQPLTSSSTILANTLPRGFRSHHATPLTSPMSPPPPLSSSVGGSPSHSPNRLASRDSFALSGTLPQLTVTGTNNSENLDFLLEETGSPPPMEVESKLIISENNIQSFSHNNTNDIDESIALDYDKESVLSNKPSTPPVYSTSNEESLQFESQPPSVVDETRPDSKIEMVVTEVDVCVDTEKESPPPKTNGEQLDVRIFETAKLESPERELSSNSSTQFLFESPLIIKENLDCAEENVSVALCDDIQSNVSVEITNDAANEIINKSSAAEVAVTSSSSKVSPVSEIVEPVSVTSKNDILESATEVSPPIELHIEENFSTSMSESNVIDTCEKSEICANSDLNNSTSSATLSSNPKNEVLPPSDSPVQCDITPADSLSSDEESLLNICEQVSNSSEITNLPSVSVEQTESIPCSSPSSQAPKESQEAESREIVSVTENTLVNSDRNKNIEFDAALISSLLAESNDVATKSENSSKDIKCKDDSDEVEVKSLEFNSLDRKEGQITDDASPGGVEAFETIDTPLPAASTHSPSTDAGPSISLVACTQSPNTITPLEASAPNPVISVPSFSSLVASNLENSSEKPSLVSESSLAGINCKSASISDTMPATKDSLETNPAEVVVPESDPFPIVVSNDSCASPSDNSDISSISVSDSDTQQTTNSNSHQCNKTDESLICSNTFNSEGHPKIDANGHEMKIQEQNSSSSPTSPQQCNSDLSPDCKLIVCDESNTNSAIPETLNSPSSPLPSCPNDDIKGLYPATSTTSESNSASAPLVLNDSEIPPNLEKPEQCLVNKTELTNSSEATTNILRADEPAPDSSLLSSTQVGSSQSLPQQNSEATENLSNCRKVESSSFNSKEVALNLYSSSSHPTSQLSTEISEQPPSKDDLKRSTSASNMSRSVSPSVPSPSDELPSQSQVKPDCSSAASMKDQNPPTDLTSEIDIAVNSAKINDAVNTSTPIKSSNEESILPLVNGVHNSNEGILSDSISDSLKIEKDSESQAEVGGSPTEHRSSVSQVQSLPPPKLPKATATPKFSEKTLSRIQDEQILSSRRSRAKKSRFGAKRGEQLVGEAAQVAKLQGATTSKPKTVNFPIDIIKSNKSSESDLTRWQFEKPSAEDDNKEMLAPKISLRSKSSSPMPSKSATSSVEKRFCSSPPASSDAIVRKHREPPPDNSEVCESLSPSQPATSFINTLCINLDYVDGDETKDTSKANCSLNSTIIPPPIYVSNFNRMTCDVPASQPPPLRKDGSVSVKTELKVPSLSTPSDRENLVWPKYVADKMVLNILDYKSSSWQNMLKDKPEKHLPETSSDNISSSESFPEEVQEISPVWSKVANQRGKLAIAIATKIPFIDSPPAIDSPAITESLYEGSETTNLGKDSTSSVDRTSAKEATTSSGSSGSENWWAAKSPVGHREQLPSQEIVDPQAWNIDAPVAFESDTDKAGYDAASDDDFDMMDEDMRRLEEKIKQFEHELEEDLEISFLDDKKMPNFGLLDKVKLRSSPLPSRYPPVCLKKSKHLSLMNQKEVDEYLNSDSESDSSSSNSSDSSDNMLFVKRKIVLKPGDRRCWSVELRKPSLIQEYKANNLMKLLSMSRTDESRTNQSQNTTVGAECGSVLQSCQGMSQEIHIDDFKMTGEYWKEDDIALLDSEDLANFYANSNPTGVCFIFEDDSDDCYEEGTGAEEEECLPFGDSLDIPSTLEMPLEGTDILKSGALTEASTNGNSTKKGKLVSSFKNTFIKATKSIAPKLDKLRNKPPEASSKELISLLSGESILKPEEMFNEYLSVGNSSANEGLYNISGGEGDAGKSRSNTSALSGEFHPRPVVGVEGDNSIKEYKLFDTGPSSTESSSISSSNMVATLEEPVIAKPFPAPIPPLRRSSIDAVAAYSPPGTLRRKSAKGDSNDKRMAPGLPQVIPPPPCVPPRSATLNFYPMKAKPGTQPRPSGN